LSHAQTNELLTTQPPGFSEEAAAAIAAEHWGVEATAGPLWSERDQNFRLRAVSGEQYVLKIANALESPEVIDFQARALEHIARTDPALPVPRAVPTRDREDYCRVADEEGREHMVRLITWLDGQIVEESEADPGLLRDAGRMLARLGLALRGFDHPASHHHLLWDLKNASELLGLLEHIDEPELRGRVEGVLKRFRDEVLPELPDLRRQVIHADLNRGNMLVSEAGPQRITGIIDFGDMVHTPLVMDLAIAAAYHLADSGDPLGKAPHMIRGYHEVTPLTGAEAAMLFDLMCARLCTSIAVQTWRAKLYPENAEYLMVPGERGVPDDPQPAAAQGTDVRNRPGSR